MPRREKDEKKDREADKKEKRDYFGDGGRKVPYSSCCAIDD